jgi:hypothetical protein
MTVQGSELAVPESAWLKSSYSTGNGGECVEVAAGERAIFVRDSKNTAGPVLTLTPGAWAGFVQLAGQRF